MRIKETHLIKKNLLALYGIALLNLLFFIIYVSSVSIPRIAVVNIRKVVQKSDQVQALTVENNKMLDDLENWIEDSEKEIQKEKNTKKKEQLIAQYQDIARQKREIIRQNYNKKLQELDSEISQIIKDVAKKNKCNTILLNTAVMEGGKDITDDVIKELPF